MTDHLDPACAAGALRLKRIAGLVNDAIQGKGQEVHRFGGEEFLVLLKDTTSADAVVVAERVRSAAALAALARTRQDKGKLPASAVTISVGAGAGHLDGETALTALVAAADGALYAAKSNGRNRVCSASQGDPSGMASALDSQLRGVTIAGPSRLGDGAVAGRRMMMVRLTPAVGARR